ncbi:MAG: ribonuclease HI [Alphaproteobacteria bacterium]|nr:ribonuclease HI [Alphaproteobacteria bacterium]
MLIHFYKMQSLGNDFVIIEQNQQLNNTAFNTEFFKKISNRNYGIGCDLIAIYKINKIENNTAFVYASFFNSDGSQAEICGNATRCIGLLMQRIKNCSQTIIQVDNSEYKVHIKNATTYLTWSTKTKISKFDLSVIKEITNTNNIVDAYKVSVGNPHLVLFVKTMPTLEEIKNTGEIIEKHSVFPNRTNVEFAVLRQDNSIDLRVFERGVGLTLGCGSGAMATAVSTKKFKISENVDHISIHQLGGNIEIKFLTDETFIQKAKAEYIFSGDIEIDELYFSSALMKETEQQNCNKNSSKITIYTDGACSGNPGPGGWGAILISNDNKISELSGNEVNTTNNKMELTAVIKALESVSSEQEIEIFTESQYVKEGITNWIKKWVKNNWKNSEKKEVKNKELWEQLLKLSANRKITWKWVRGHNGDTFNEKVDALARNECSKLPL